MYLNAYVPSLQTGAGFAYFLRNQLDCRVPSTFMIAPMSREFVTAIERFVEAEGVDLVTFSKGERKDDVAREYLAQFRDKEGLLLVGKAQEKASVFQTEKRVDANGIKYPWLVRSTAMVNHYYFYIVDRDFGPLFIKFCSYFPYPSKLCLNGNEWLKRQLRKRGIRFKPLDNDILSCKVPKRVQRIANSLNEKKIEAVFRKWLRRLPHPFKAKHRAAGYRYRLSVLQAEFALTQVLDRPLTGRCFFEEVIRENLDLVRPSQVQLIFGRRVTRRTPGRFRTRVLTEGTIPSLHVDYKASRIKQYHKEGQALRTETTINNTYDFQIGRSLSNLSALRKIVFEANRRLLRAQHLSHDCLIGEDRFQSMAGPIVVDDQRASGLTFRTSRSQFSPNGLSNNELARQLGTSRPTVILWRDRYVEQGLPGLLRDASRPGRKPRLSARKVERVVERTLHSKPRNATHWTVRTMAKAEGLSPSMVHRIWRAHGLQPHRVRTFKVSEDPEFVRKVRDVVGLYLDPPEKALVSSADEKSQIQALDRSQPALPMRFGSPERHTHDYVRHGTTTLFAALNILDGKVIGSCKPRHRHIEFLDFLDRIDRSTPKRREIHLVLDNYGTHRHPKVEQWLEEHPRFHVHFVPTGSSWLNLVECWFSQLTTTRVRRGTFRNVPSLIRAIQQYIRGNNKDPKPFIWTASAAKILRKVRRCKELLETGH